MALLFVQTHLSMSLFVQLWQQPHHNTDSTRMDNGTVSCFPSAGKSCIRLIIIIIINNSKESPTMFQQSTALKPPSSNQAPHLKLKYTIQMTWNSRKPWSNKDRTEVAHELTPWGPACSKMCSSLFKQTLPLKVLAIQRIDNQRDLLCISSELGSHFLL